jgi:hypothetical protein
MTNKILTPKVAIPKSGKSKNYTEIFKNFDIVKILQTAAQVD